MASGIDTVNYNKVRSHINAAKANPKRAELELTQADGFAELIVDAPMRKGAMQLIANAKKFHGVK